MLDDESRICKNCGHDIDWHRFLKSAKPKACVATIKKNKDDDEKYCPCKKFIPMDN